MKRKNEILVEKCYNYHFYWSDSLILEGYYCEKILQKYSFSQRIPNIVLSWLTSKNAVFCCFLESITDKLSIITFD